MGTNYKLPLRIAQAEFTEKKSRFISSLAPVATEDEALSFLRSIRAQHREAAHNVYSYRIKSGEISRHSDDGEPSGTAGIPLLQVFLKQDIYDFCCVATRYFGGTLLGAGGLVRAYAHCGAIALEASGVGEMKEVAICAATIPYPLYEPVKRLVHSCGAAIVSEDFGSEVALVFSLISGDLAVFERKFNELTAGAIGISVQDIRLSIMETQS